MEIKQDADNILETEKNNEQRQPSASFKSLQTAPSVNMPVGFTDLIGHCLQKALNQTRRPFSSLYFKTVVLVYKVKGRQLYVHLNLSIIFIFCALLLTKLHYVTYLTGI